MQKKELFITTAVLLVLGTSMHFVHHLPFFGHVMGWIFPVNESVWEHMKMIFYPSVLLALYMWISRKEIGRITGPIAAGLVGFPLAQALFYVYQPITHHSVLLIDIIAYIIEVIVCVYLGQRWSGSEKLKKMWPLAIVVALCMAVLLGWLSYHAPDMFLFEIEEE